MSLSQYFLLRKFARMTCHQLSRSHLYCLFFKCSHRLHLGKLLLKCHLAWYIPETNCVQTNIIKNHEQYLNVTEKKRNYQKITCLVKLKRWRIQNSLDFNKICKNTVPDEILWDAEFCGYMFWGDQPPWNRQLDVGPDMRCSLAGRTVHLSSCLQ